MSSLSAFCCKDELSHVAGMSVVVLLLAYFNGNASLCRAVVKVGARLGVVNRDGLSIFNAPVATKQLLFKLLGAFAEDM